MSILQYITNPANEGWRNSQLCTNTHLRSLTPQQFTKSISQTVNTRTLSKFAASLEKHEVIYCCSTATTPTHCKFPYFCLLAKYSHTIILISQLRRSREVFICCFITKSGCAVGVGCEGGEGAGAQGAGWRREGSPGTSQANLAAAGTARTGAGLVRRPRATRPGTPAAGAAAPTRTPPGAAEPAAVEPGRPTVPTVLPPALRTEDMRPAKTVVT